MVTINIILASKSPRRKEILERFIKDLKIIENDSEENFNEEFDIISNIMSISRNKGLEISKEYPNSLVISADTIVYYKDKILHKPKNKQEAKSYLKLLSNKTHTVVTSFSISLYNDITICDYVKTQVKFNKLDDEIIDTYLKTLEWCDKAGGYGIQGYGSVLVEKIDGDFFSVMGIPINIIFFYLYKYFKLNLMEG